MRGMTAMVVRSAAEHGTFCIGPRTKMQPRGPLKVLGALGVCLLLCITIFAMLAPFAVADDVIMPNMVGGEEVERFSSSGPRRKKPFCNAFTGCGRKRSDPSMLLRRSDESMVASLADLSSAEPAVAELSRQILSEAKMLEAIQEARDEIIRQHDKASLAGQLASRQARPYRKRRSVDPSDFDRRFAAEAAGRLRFF